MSGYTHFRKGFEQHQPAATGTGDSATNKQTQLFLNKDYLTSKYLLHIVSSQTYTVQPTAFTPQNCIDTIQLEFAGAARGGNGMRINMTGKELYELMKYVKNTPTPITAFGASPATGEWLLDIGLAMQRAFNDMMTAAYTGEFSQVKLTINWNTTTTGIFTGGTMTGAVSHTVDVLAYATPVPNKAAGSNHEYVATAQQIMNSVTKTPTGAGNGDDVLLTTGLKSRFIMVTTYDNNGALSDAICDQITMLFGGFNFQTTFKKLKLVNFIDMNYSSTGTAIIDFGPDPAAWLDLTKLNEARLKWTALAAGTVRFAQISIKSLQS